ncbi:hypothetical protein AU476_23185 [Cupriavidus sp. UYMSc13B]|nr:hypothetical protein AU476_23185 [Cupriavidus sp. UYMSc13B]
MLPSSELEVGCQAKAIATTLERRSFAESVSWLEGPLGLSALFQDEGSAMKAFLTLLIAASTLLGGCVVAPYDGGYYGGGYYGPHRYWGHRHYGYHGRHGDYD